MALATSAIVLSSIKYGDNSLIVRMYGQQTGLLQCMLKGILGRRKGKLSPGLFQPLSQLEVIAVPGRNGKLGYLKEAVIGVPYTTIPTDIHKSAIAIFLAETLSQSLREEAADPLLYQYLQSAFCWLDGPNPIANFHLLFLIGLTRYLGFYPDDSTQEGGYFDMVEGAFSTYPPAGLGMSGEQVSLFRQLLGINFDGIALVKMNKSQRRELLRSLVNYYEIHLQGFRKPRSLDVLDEVFS